MDLRPNIIPVDADGPVCSVVVVSWNRQRELAVLLESIERQTIRDQIEVIVIDNGSDDGTAEWLASGAPPTAIRLFRYAKNEGACVARNAGIKLARAPFVCFIDSDAEILSPNTLERCLQEFEIQPERDAISCPIWSNRARTQPFLLGGYVTPDFHYDGWACHNRMDAPMLFSTCFAVWRRESLEEVHGFDPWYFWGIEDMDLGLRVYWKRRAAGQTPYAMVDDVHVLHEMSDSGRLYDKDAFDERFLRYERERLYMVLSSRGLLYFFRIMARTPFRWKRMNAAYANRLTRWQLFQGSVLLALPRLLALPKNLFDVRRDHLAHTQMPDAMAVAQPERVAGGATS